MNVKFELTGPGSELSELIHERSENFRQAVRQTFFRMGRDLKSKTNKDILDKSSKTGRIYKVYFGKGGLKLSRPRLHRSSAPGQTHANLTGALRESIGWRTRGTDTLEFGYGLTRTAPDYASHVERGTSKMDARPSLLNNIKKEQASFEKYFKQAVDSLEE